MTTAASVLASTFALAAFAVPPSLSSCASVKHSTEASALQVSSARDYESVSQILLEIHDILAAYPSVSPEKAKSDRPLPGGEYFFVRGDVARFDDQAVSITLRWNNALKRKPGKALKKDAITLYASPNDFALDERFSAKSAELEDGSKSFELRVPIVAVSTLADSNVRELGFIELALTTGPDGRIVRVMMRENHEDKGEKTFLAEDVPSDPEEK